MHVKLEETAKNKHDSKHFTHFYQADSFLAYCQYIRNGRALFESDASSNGYADDGWI